MRNAARVICAANIRFHGVLGSGYGMLMLSSLYTPFTKLAVAKEFHKKKL
jgi:hypothetical protein